METIDLRRQMSAAKGVPGITQVPRANGKIKWEAYITVHGRKIRLGCHDNVIDALAARNAGEKKYWSGKRILR